MDPSLAEAEDAERGRGPVANVLSPQAPSSPEGSQPTSEPSLEVSPAALGPGCPRPKVSRSCPSIVDDGITELWTPAKSSAIVADLCFVHGLGGHPHDTWTYRKTNAAAASGEKSKERSSLSSLLQHLHPKKKKQPAENEVGNDQHSGPDGRNDTACFWPLDLVPDDFNNVRILTYSYDSNPSHFYKGSTNQMTITQHAQKLLQQVTDSRSECRGRPIIFVAHSLGGILVKDMIIQSGKYQHQPKFMDVSKCTFAIIFFGTPHHGANAARYGEIVSSVVSSLPGGFSVYKEVLRGLKPDGEKLSNTTADFNDILNEDIPAQEKIQLYSFQEGKPFSGVKSLDGKIVSDTSSFFNRRDIEQVSFIARNHMNMCRFQSAGVAGYIDFKSALGGYLDGIKSKADQSVIRTQAQAGNLAAAEHEALRQCFDFKERLVRQQQIESLALIEATFTWLWSSPFISWLQSSSPLFWISGKPASGKSTLMSHIAQNPKTLEFLGQVHGPDWQLVYHFFDFRAGDSIGNNFEGLLRSFLLQLLQGNPNLLSGVPELRPFVAENSVVSRSSINTMYTALKKSIAASSTRLFVLLDGLDEYKGQQVELVNLINTLGSDRVRFCLASRADPPFPDAFHGVPSFEMHRLNTSGIKAFAAQTLRTFFSRSEDFDHMALQKIADDISQRSSGVFLWARFAIFELIDGLTRGETWDSATLSRRLEQVPQELQDIYSRIFRRRTQESRETAGLILLLISSSHDELVVGTLREAVDLLPRDLLPFQSSILSSFDKSAMVDNVFKKAILAATGGTLEIYTPHEPDSLEPGPEPLVRLSHRTVKSYLDLRGWQELLGINFSRGLGNFLWLQICAKTLLPDRLKPSPPRLREDRWGRGTHPDAPCFWDYTLYNLPGHATLFEEESQQSSFTLISAALSTDFVYGHQMAHGGGECRYCCLGLSRSVCEPIHLAIAHGWLRYVEEYLSGIGRGIIPKVPNVRKVAIGCACRETRSNGPKTAAKHDDILALVLKHHPIVEDNDVIEGLTGGSPAVLQILLQYREPGKHYLKPSEPPHEYSGPHIWKEGERYGPLWFIAERETSDADTEAIIELLLERGEDINDACGPLGGMLHGYIQWCAVNCYSPTYNSGYVELLIRKGLDINLSGPRGNALEYLWQAAMEHIRATYLGPAIAHLIELGLVNRRQDPDGHVPSVDEMLWKAEALKKER